MKGKNWPTSQKMVKIWQIDQNEN